MPSSPILIASDLSARTDRAVDRAILLGKQLSRPVCLVHVREAKPEEHEDLAMVEQFVRASLSDPGAPMEIVLPEGSVPEEIDHAAEEHDAAMIVCGVARFNDFHDYITGTAVDRIISTGRRPVLVVKQRPHGDYRKLVATVDFSDHSANALKTAADLFPDADITLLHAYKVAYEGLQKGAHLKDETREMHEKSLAEFLDRAELSGLKDRVKSKLVYGTIGEPILKAVNELDPDLVVAGTRGAGAARRATLGSIASQMLEWVPQDMLVVPPKKD